MLEWIVPLIVLIVFAAFIYHQKAKKKDNKSLSDRYFGGLKDKLGGRRNQP